MSRLTSEYENLLARLPDSEWVDRFSHRRRREHLGPHPGLVAAGLVAVGIGLLAIYYVGPDVKRYMKLRNM